MEMTNERAAEILNPTHVEIMEQKLARWKYRLMKKEEPDVPEE